MLAVKNSMNLPGRMLTGGGDDRGQPGEEVSELTVGPKDDVVTIQRRGGGRPRIPYEHKRRYAIYSDFFGGELNCAIFAHS